MMFAQQISYYKLIKKLGSGGMGEVYLAEDTRLSRKVALKVLPPEVALDRKRISRFWQEARLAANLNHPNICIIYEVSDASETPFIAMEYVAGETLFDKIRAGSLDLADTLEMAAQVADALDEAHEQGVIHRDIKPANIIINRRGLSKVLDFGLAKTVIEEVSDEAVTQAKTEAGILVGTVQYMSPEHALGKSLDGRTDLWSLGVLLYETLTGEVPFKGDTQVAIFDEILHKSPVSPSELNKNIPTELEKIILKLLEKQREFRYQTASDLHADLKRLQRNTGEYLSAKTIENRPSAETPNTPQTLFIETQTDELSAQTTTGAVFAPDAKNIGRNVFIGLLSVVLLALAGLTAYHFGWSKTSSITFEKREVQRITNLGKVLDAVISSDGKYLVYAQDEGQLQSLWLKQIVTGSTVQVIPPSSVVFQGLTVSADNNWVYYNIWDKKGVGEIFRVPVLGGIPQKVIHDCMPGVDISPDSRQIAFIRSYDAERKNDLIVADIETHEEKTLLSRGRDDGGLHAFAWSPDGKTIAAISSKRASEDDVPIILSEVALADQKETTIWTVPAKMRNFSGGLIWKPDKSGILMTVTESENPYYQIWQISYPNGEARQITKDFNSYGRLSLTADGKNLASVQRDFSAGLWVWPVDNSSQPQKITTGKIEGFEPEWTPDGKLIYGSTISGNVDIWMSDADGANKKQLTADGFVDTDPCVSADGKTIAFASNRHKDTWRIWLMNIDGSNLRQLLPDGEQWKSFCSRLDNSILFYGTIKNRQGLWKMPLAAGGEPVFLWSSGNSPFPIGISPDEKHLAYSFWNTDKKQMEQEIYTIGSGQTERFSLPASAIGEGQPEPAIRWTPDGRHLTFINEEKGTTNIWMQSRSADHKLKKITDFNEYRIFRYVWSPDGKKLAVLRGMETSDVVLIKEEK